MKRFLCRLLGLRPIIQNVDTFGPRLEWAEVQNALLNRESDPLFRAVGQMVEFQRQQCQEAVQDKSNLVAEQVRFEAGAASSAADILTMLTELAAGECHRAGLKEWFGSNRDKSGKVG